VWSTRGVTRHAAVGDELERATIGERAGRGECTDPEAAA
jgi:hypothetical protein